MFCGVSVTGTMTDQPLANRIKKIEARRCPGNPLITFESSPTLGENINGPSVIRVPDWIENPLGKYYMYFAHHGGLFIRLAYADEPDGPWHIYEPGTLRLEQVEAEGIFGHIASPDVHPDSEAKEIRMCFHCPKKKSPNQHTLAAYSRDGLNFIPGKELLGISYFRVFEWEGYFYAIDGGGYLTRSVRFDSGWERLEDHKLIPPVLIDDPYGRRENVRLRHSAVVIEDNVLFVFYSRKEDAPERILVATVELKGDWTQWKASDPIDVLSPEHDYEGAGFPIEASRNGSAINVRQLRDPCIFVEDDRWYLFYTTKGEMGIAMAELSVTLRED